MLLKTFISLALLSAWPVVAHTIIVSGTDSALGENVYISENGTNTQVWAGGIDIKVDGYTRLAFCIELFVNINIATYNTTLDFSDTSSNIRRVAWLLQNQYPTSAAAGAGFQLAVWDIMTDNGDGFSAGLVRKASGSNATTKAVLDDAVAYEAASNLKSSSVEFVVYHNSTTKGVAVQTLMGPWPTDGGPIPETPEPAALVMIFSGLVLIGLGRLRRARRG